MLRHMLSVVVGGVLLVQPVAADGLYGLQPGDVIETIGFTSYGASGASFDFNSDVLEVEGQLLDITTDLGVVYLDIGGGTVTFNAQFTGVETTTKFPAPNGRYALYEATFTTPLTREDGFSMDLSVPDDSPVKGENLLKGDVMDLTVAGVINLDGDLADVGLALYAHVDVKTGLGNPQFELAFGSGEVPPKFDGTIVAGTRDFSNGGLGSLMQLDENENVLLFSREDLGIPLFSFELATGEIMPTKPSPAPAEPTTLALGLGVGLVILRRRRTV